EAPGQVERLGPRTQPLEIDPDLQAAAEHDEQPFAAVAPAHVQPRQPQARPAAGITGQRQLARGRVQRLAQPGPRTVLGDCTARMVAPGPIQVPGKCRFPRHHGAEFAVTWPSRRPAETGGQPPAGEARIPPSQTRSAFMDFIIWLIVGGVIGWLASLIMKTDAQQGILLNVVVGIVGAFIGGWLIAPLIGGTTGTGGFNFMGFIAALIGAIILLAII